MKSQGFSLIELLVVLVILGLLAGLVVPNVLGRLGGAKYRSAKSQITVLQSAIDGFALDTGRLPDDLNELIDEPSDADFWSGPYAKRQLLTDPWGNPYRYSKPGEKGAYDLMSYAEDGQPGGDGMNKDISIWD